MSNGNTALVLSADHYTITDQGTGQVNDLRQVWMINEYREASDREFGSKPIKTLIDAAVFSELVKHPLPSLFSLEMAMRPGKGNTPAVTVVGFKFISTPTIFSPPVRKAA
jgi:hypothetical protein